MKNFARYKDLIHFRALLESRVENRQFYLGLGWWLLEPLVNLAMMYLVFGVILQRGGPGFAGFLLVGFVFWRWTDNCVKKALTSLTAAKNILTQVKLPAWLFPLSDILSACTRFLIVLVLLAIFTTWYSGKFGWAYLALPVVLMLNLGFLIGLGMSLSLLPAFFPDSKKIIDNLFALLFFLSGIFYDISKLDEQYAQYLYLNPIASFLTSYRMIMLEDKVPTLMQLQVPLASTLVLLTVAMLAYRRYSPGLSKALLR